MIIIAGKVCLRMLGLSELTAFANGWVRRKIYSLSQRNQITVKDLFTKAAPES